MALPAKVTLPNTIANGDTSDATLLMADLTALATALNLPIKPDEAYDDLDWTLTWANGVVTKAVGARDGVTVIDKTTTYTNGVPTQVVTVLGPTGSQVTVTKTITYTNGLPTSTATTVA